MGVVVGPVLPRPGGYAFATWTWDEGLSLGYVYPRLEDAHQAVIDRLVAEYTLSDGSEPLDDVCICSTVEQFLPELLERGVRLTDNVLHALCSAHVA
jgi:hypothetical protein